MSGRKVFVPEKNDSGMRIHNVAVMIDTRRERSQVSTCHASCAEMEHEVSVMFNWNELRGWKVVWS